MTRSVRMLVAAVLVMLLVAVGTVVVRHRGDDRPARPEAKAGGNAIATAALTDKEGFAFVNGKFVDRPYTVAVVGDGIQLNGAVIRTLPRPPARQQPPTDPKTAYDVAEIGQARLPQNDIVPAAARAELVAYLKALPPTADVRETEASLVVVDRAGDEAPVLLNRHIPIRAAQVIALADRAKEWQQLLNKGGLLMVSPDATVQVSAAKTGGVLTDLAAAATLPDAERPRRLARILGSSALAAALVDAGGVPRAALDRLPKPPAGSAAAGIVTDGGSGGGPRRYSVATGPGDARTAGATADAASDVITPTSNKAYIFDLFAEPDTSAPRRAATDQGYTVVEYNHSGDLNDSTPADRHWRINDPDSRTLPDGRVVWFAPAYMFGIVQQLRNFLSISENGGAGLLYVSTHGDSTYGLVLSGGAGGGRPISEMLRATTVYDASWKGPKYPNHWAELKQMIGTELGLTKTKGGPDFEFNYSTDGMFLGPTPIKSHWKDASSIVHLAACYGFTASLINAFGAREFIGPKGPTFTFSDPATGTWQYSQPNDFATEFYERLDGIRESGKKRTVGDAMAGSDQALVALTRYRTLGLGGGIGQFAHEGSGHTVLAPSVSGRTFQDNVTLRVTDEAGNEKENTVDGSIAFDASMVPVKAEVAVLATGSCRPEIVPGTLLWDGARTLKFSYKPHENGIAIFRLRAPPHQSSGNATPLDGNTNPSNSDRVGPGGDAYEFRVTCMC